MGSGMESRRADCQLIHVFILTDDTYIAVVQAGDRPSQETILHTGTLNVCTVQDANTPTSSGEMRIGCGKDWPSRFSFLFGGLRSARVNV